MLIASKGSSETLALAGAPRSHTRSTSADRSHRRHSHHRRSPTESHCRKHRKEGRDEENDRHADASAKETKKAAATAADGGGNSEVPADTDPNELEMMKKLGIHVGFDSTEGKPVSGNNLSAVRMVTKRQPRLISKGHTPLFP